MAAVIATSRRPAFNPYQFDRVSTAPRPVSSNDCAACPSHSASRSTRGCRSCCNDTRARVSRHDPQIPCSPGFRTTYELAGPATPTNKTRVAEHTGQLDPGWQRDRGGGPRGVRAQAFVRPSRGKCTFGSFVRELNSVYDSGSCSLSKTATPATCSRCTASSAAHATTQKVRFMKVYKRCSSC